MRKTIPCLILSFALPLSAADFLNSSHAFPVASRTDGLAGTLWTTSLEIVNPQPHPLMITMRLSAHGGFETRNVELAAGETRRWADVMGEIFGADGNGALFAEADAALNPLLAPECRAFGAAMRISTAADGGGSYGQGVPSLDPSSGFLGDWTAYLPGVALWGEPGRDGFRTNAGFWNVGADEARIRLRLLDPAGHQVWQQVVAVARHDPLVVALPRALDLETGTLVADALGEWADCAVYISVVDNVTGDATFRTGQLRPPDGGGGCGAKLGSPGTAAVDRNRSPQRLRELFLGARP